MKRAARISLKFVTVAKRRKITALLEAYRSAVNFYIQSMWAKRGKLDKATLARLEDTRLSERYKSQALRQALNIIITTKKSAKALETSCKMPVFKGSAILDAKFISVSIEKGEPFDIFIKLSTLHKRHQIIIPSKRTAVLNKWLKRRGAKIIQGCALSEHRIILWVDVPDRALRQTGRILGADIGINKLISTSDGKHYGREFKAIRDKVMRKVQGSKGKQRALRARDNYVNRIVNLLPWKGLKAIGVEDLKGLKQGKKKNRSKKFRKAIAPWTYRRVLNRIEAKAAENGVRLLRVPPANTSRTCPKCSSVHKANRKGEEFACISCGYTGDADTVGARNILARTYAILGSVESPRLRRAV